MSMQNKYTISAGIYSILMDTHKKKSFENGLPPYICLCRCKKVHSLIEHSGQVSVPTLSVHGDHF